jgi:hypothetical protein
MAVKTIPLFKNTSAGVTSTAGTALSDPIDLGDIPSVTSMSMTYSLASTGAVATCGSSVFSYLVSPTFDGAYRQAGTFGTHGATPENDIISLGTLRLSKFMKVQVTGGTSAPTVVTAELNIN